GLPPDTSQSDDRIQRLSDPRLPALTRRPRKDISEKPTHAGPRVGWLCHPRLSFILAGRPSWVSLSIMNSSISFEVTDRPLMWSRNGSESKLIPASPSGRHPFF